MEHYSEHSPYVPPEGGSDKRADKKDGKKKKSPESVITPLERKEEKTEKAEAIGKSETLWQRVIGDDAKEEAKEKSTATQESEAEGEISLTDSEAKEIALEHVEHRQEAVAGELQHTAPGTVEATVAAADAVLLEHDQTHLANDDESFREALQQAQQETEQAIAQPALITEQLVHAETEYPPKPAQEVSELASSQGHEVQQGPETHQHFSPSSSSEQTLATPHAAESVYPGLGVVPSAEIQPTHIEEITYENPDNGVGAGLLAGGVFGYLWGRRRGPKQAERRFRPFQRKTERAIRQIKSEVATQETHIRDLAARQYNMRAKANEQGSNRRQPERGMPPSNHPVEAAAVPSTAERPATSQSIPTETVPSLNHAPEVLTDRETLAWAEKIIIDGASVRSVYEAKRISESGLKYVVHEYLRGGNVRKALAEEMLRKELSYERDPVLREHFSGAEISAGSTNTLGNFTNPPPVRSGAAPKLASKLPNQATLSNLATSPHSMVMAAWVTFIIVLACVAVVLLLTK